MTRNVETKDGVMLQRSVVCVFFFFKEIKKSQMLIVRIHVLNLVLEGQCLKQSQTNIMLGSVDRCRVSSRICSLDQFSVILGMLQSFTETLTTHSRDLQGMFQYMQAARDFLTF